MATEVGHLLDQAISLGNTQVGGKYVFAGYRTGNDAFVKFNNGTIDTAQYNGDGNDFQVARRARGDSGRWPKRPDLFLWIPHSLTP